MNVETQAQADELNRTGLFGPYRAANGHTMIAPVRFPRVRGGSTEDGTGSVEVDYQPGDTIRYDSWAAYCADGCDHSESGPPEDW